MKETNLSVHSKSTWSIIRETCGFETTTAPITVGGGIPSQFRESDIFVLRAALGPIPAIVVAFWTPRSALSGNGILARDWYSHLLKINVLFSISTFVTRYQ